MTDIAVLEIQVKTTGIDKATRDLHGLEGQSKKVETATQRMERSFQSLKRIALIAFSGWGLSKLISDLKEVAFVGARYETLGVVVERVGRNAGYSAEELKKYENALRASGIAAVESRTTLTRMMQAQIDLTKAQKLARIAQDAAVIGNINSSEAFERMIYGIQSAQLEMLRTIGINVNFEQSYAKIAKQLGINTNELTELQKATARTNVVIEAGTQISGVYEAAMSTAGKQLTSLPRYLADFKASMGKAFNPATASAVKKITDIIKDLTKWISTPEIQNDLAQLGSMVALSIQQMADNIMINKDDIIGFFKDLGSAGKAIYDSLTPALKAATTALSGLVVLYNSLPGDVVAVGGAGLIGRILFGTQGAIILAGLAAVEKLKVERKSYEESDWLTKKGVEFLAWLNNVEIATGKAANAFVEMYTAQGSIWVHRDDMDVYQANLNKIDDATRELGDFSKESFAKTQLAIDKANKELEKYYKELDKSKDAMDRVTLAAMPEYERGIESIIRKYAEWNEAIEKNAKLAGYSIEEIAQLHKDLGTRMDEEIDDYVKSHEEAVDEVSESWINAYNKISDTLADWIQTGKFNLSNFFDWIKHSLAQLAATKITGSAAMALGLPGAASWAGIGVGGSGDGGAGKVGGSQSLYGTGTSLAGGLWQGLGDVGTWMSTLPTNLTASIGSAFSDMGFSAGASFMGSLNNFFASHLSVSGGLTAGMGTFLLSGLMTGDWGTAAMAGGGAGLGAALGTAIFPGIGTLLGGLFGGTIGNIFGGLFGGNKKRSYLGREYTYGAYSPESGWGAPEMHEYKEKRKGEKYRESAETMAQSGRDLANAMDTLFKNLLGSFGESWEKYFTIEMGRMATEGLRFKYSIGAEDKKEFKEDWEKAWRRMTEGLINPIVDAGTELLRQALDKTITDSSTWSYFTNEMNQYLSDSLEGALGDLKIDWSEATDQESLEAAFEKLGIAADKIQQVLNYITTVESIMTGISDAISMHGFSEVTQAAIHTFRDINAQFDQFALTLKSFGIDLKKYTDLEKAHSIALQDAAQGMSDAGMSGEELSIALQHMSDTMIAAGHDAEDVAFAMSAVIQGIMASIESIRRGTGGGTVIDVAREKYEDLGTEWTESLAAWNFSYDFALRRAGEMGITLEKYLAEYTDNVAGLLQDFRNVGQYLSQQEAQRIEDARRQAESAYGQWENQQRAQQREWEKQQREQQRLHDEWIRAQEQIIRSLENAAESIAKSIADLTLGSKAPVQSMKAMQTNYTDLYNAVQEAAPKDMADAAKAFSNFASGLYLEFMQAYAPIDYATAFASTIQDLKALRELLLTQNIPVHQSGGLTHGLSFAGEIGPEWVVPTYEPQRSSFLKDVGADPEAIGKSVAKYIMMSGSNNNEKEIHVHLEIDGQSIRNPVIVGLQGRDSELIKATRRIAV